MEKELEFSAHEQVIQVLIKKEWREVEYEKNSRFNHTTQVLHGTDQEL